MAKVTSVVDDFTGNPIDGDVKRTTVTIDDLVYELDLSPESRETLEEALHPFLQRTTPVRQTPIAGKRTAENRTSAKLDREQARNIRSFWQQAYNRGVQKIEGGELPTPSDRGRIPAVVEALYHRHGGVVPEVESEAVSDDGGTEPEAASNPAADAEPDTTDTTDTTDTGDTKSKKKKKDSPNAPPAEFSN